RHQILGGAHIHFGGLRVLLRDDFHGLGVAEVNGDGRQFRVRGLGFLADAPEAHFRLVLLFFHLWGFGLLHGGVFSGCIKWRQVQVAPPTFLFFLFLRGFLFLLGWPEHVFEGQRGCFAVEVHGRGGRGDSLSLLFGPGRRRSPQLAFPFQNV